MFHTVDEERENNFKVLNQFWKQQDDFREKLKLKDCTEQFIQHAKTVLKGIEKTINEASNEQKQLIELYYKEEETDYAAIADELYISKNRAIRLHKYIVEEFGRNIGFI